MSQSNSLTCDKCDVGGNIGNGYGEQSVVKCPNCGDEWVVEPPADEDRRQETVDGDRQQATLGMTGEQHIDEYGNHDQWGRGGVYDAAGEFDLEATKAELKSRFDPVSDRLPELVNRYEREPAREDYIARFRWSGHTTNRRGRVVSERVVRVFPRGPHLHEWSVKICERFADDGGTCSWIHQDALALDSPGAAAATALAYMRQSNPVPPSEYPRLKFSATAQETVATADRQNGLAATIRYDDERNIGPKEHLRLLDASTEAPIGTAVVDDVEEVPLNRALAVVEESDAVYGICDAETLQSELNRYYDTKLGPETQVKVILLKPRLDSDTSTRTSEQ